MEREQKTKITVTKIPDGFHAEYKGKEGIATGVGSTKTDALREMDISKKMLTDDPLKK